MPHPSLLCITIALILTAICAVSDARAGRIPNWFTVPALVLAPILHAIHTRQLPPIWGLSGAAVAAAMSILSAVSCALVPMLLLKFRLAGAGDTKLLAAVGALLLPDLGLAVEFVAFALAASFIPARLAYRGRLFATLGNTFAMLSNPLLSPPRRHRLPNELAEQIRLGPFVFVSALVVTLFRSS